DYMWGGLGRDRIEGGDDQDDITGEAGNDELYGGDSNDRLTGDDGDDVLDGGKGDDRYLIRGSGRDTITKLGTTSGNFDTVDLDVFTSYGQMIQYVGSMRNKKTGAVETLVVFGPDADDVVVIKGFDIRTADNPEAQFV